jgi:hypothetical protein
VLVLLLAGSAIVLAVPRAVEPQELPRPLVDGRALTATIEQDDALARLAESTLLDVDVRAVGTELRRYNAAAARKLDDEVVQSRGKLMTATIRALARSQRELLALRAYQTKRFVAELRQWQSSGVVSEELEQLGGDFLVAMRRNGWCRGAERELVLDERILRIVYKKRWNDLTGAAEGPFALTLEEDRLRFSFFLGHPWVERDEPPSQSPIDRLQAEARSNRARLATIDRLERVDPSYPANLARGVVLYGMRQFAASADAFRRELDRTPDGPYRLRAQNYLKAALDRTREGLF